MSTKNVNKSGFFLNDRSRTFEQFNEEDDEDEKY
jgi:hypothetical protein